MEEIEVISREKVTVVTQVKEVAHFNGEKGDPGEKGNDGTDGVSIINAFQSNGDLILGLSNGQVLNAGALPLGPKGNSGLNGQDGSDGVSVTSVSFVGDDLQFAFSDGQTFSFANVKGQDGNSITAARLENGELILTNSDGTELNVGNVKGDDGMGYVNAYINGSGHLILVRTNLTEDYAGDLNQFIESTGSVEPGTILTFTTDGVIDGYLRLDTAQLIPISSQPDLAASGKVELLPAGSPTSGSSFGVFDLSAQISFEATALAFLSNLNRVVLFSSDATGSLCYTDVDLISAVTTSFVGKQLSFSANYKPIIAADADYAYIPCSDGSIVKTDGVTHTSVSLGSANVGVVSTFICDKTARLFAANFKVNEIIEIYESIDKGATWNEIYTGTNFEGTDEVITGLIVANQTENRLLVTSNKALLRFDSAEAGNIYASGFEINGITFQNDNFVYYSSGSVSIVDDGGFWAGNSVLSPIGPTLKSYRGALIVEDQWDGLNLYPGFKNIPLYLEWIQPVTSPRAILISNGLLLAVSSEGVICKLFIYDSLEDEIVVPAIPDNGSLKHYMKF